MKSRFLVVMVIIECLFAPAVLFAQDSVNTPNINWTGMAALEEGQFVKCEFTNGPMGFRPWLTDVYARIGINATLNRHLRLSVIPQFELWNDTWDWTTLANNPGSTQQIQLNPLTQHAIFSIADAEGILSFGNKDAIEINIAAGVIPYKYNEEARNLGEYLFRTGEHPTYILNSFDQAYATLTGLRVNSEIFNNLSVDIFLTTETQIQPMNDWSLSFLAGYKIPGFLDVGAGIMFDRLFQAVPLLDKQADGNVGTYLTRTGQLDTFAYGGTKVMARVALDPKGFLSQNFAGIFGKEDGKIFCEVAILGLTNITAYTHPNDTNTGQPNPNKVVVDSSHNFYSDIKQRIPIMVGFNVPTFKLLDYLSVAYEWFGDPFAPGINTEDNFRWILPEPNGVDPANSHLKFSINAQRSWGHLEAIGQIARDHTRHDIFSVANADQNEIFQTQDEWGWWMKLQYNF
jgi:hypothetical protein